jgi:predicted glycoside hydrolase/deacetylase ChbG (UPF0249 family)
VEHRERDSACAEANDTMTSRGSLSARSRIIIVNADDYGASHQINRAILKAFEKGIVSSTTIMANMPGFQEACELARQRQLDKNIGLHLTLTAGQPLSAPIKKCPRFCDADGCWLPRTRTLALTTTEEVALETEIEAQIHRCYAGGITPTHLDSHHSVHSELAISTIAIRLVKRFGIRAIRLNRNCGPPWSSSSALRTTVARAVRCANNIRLCMHGLARTKYFGDAQDTAAILQNTDADVEVMVHPQFDNSGRLVDMNGEDLEAEIKALRIPPQHMCSFYTS